MDEKRMTDGIRGKAAIVTGGTRGIGRAIAARLLEEGARVAICGSRQETVDAALEFLRERHRREDEPRAPNRTETDYLFGMVTDVSKRNECERMVAAAAEKFGTVEILVNSAGIGLFAGVSELTPEQWERMISVNLSGVYYCCHAVLPIFRTGGGGDVVNISSLAGSNAFAGGAGYNASKFGLNGFSEAMMQDYRNEGVRVSYVMPGSVDTEFNGRTETGANGDYGGRVAPGDVAEVVATILAMPRRTTVSRVEIRPSRPPRK